MEHFNDVHSTAFSSYVHKIKVYICVTNIITRIYGQLQFIAQGGAVGSCKQIGVENNN
jgi:hypothetical protein